LTETPPDGRDLLSDLLGGMHLSGMVLFRAEFREPWSVVAPDGRNLGKVLPFHTEHIIPFHIIAAGGCRLGLKDPAPVWLAEGDAVLLPHGDGHSLYGSETAAVVEVGRLPPPPPWADILVVEHGGAGAKTSIICGFLQCDELLFHPLLRCPPRLLRVRPAEDSGDRWLGSTIRHTAAEAGRPSPGSRSMLPRLTELMFGKILRAHIHGLSADDAGWFAALKDPVAGAAQMAPCRADEGLERPGAGASGRRVAQRADRAFPALSRPAADPLSGEMAAAPGGAADQDRPSSHEGHSRPIRL
jgi:hypothetical protein